MAHPVTLGDAQAARDAYVATLRELVELESPTSDKRAVDALGAHLEKVLAAKGWSVSKHPREAVGDVLEATRGGAGGPSTLLLTHMDTVWPLGTLEVMPARDDGERFWGPGALDMKAGIAAAIHAVDLLDAKGLAPRGGVTLLVTSDEEVGSGASRALIEDLARRHDRVLVLEPGRDDGALKVGRKGVGGYKVTFKGRSAHAGNDPASGASALRELAHFLLYVEDLADDVAGTTVNLTVARGGIASNVIAEEAVASVDLRVLKASEAERVDAAVRAYRPRDVRVTVSIEGGLNRPPLEKTAANAALFEEAVAVGGALGLELTGAVV
ncbi:MAG TPA: M20/M25/M40 family metallo-hydrolase, partial [Trueperaceae bacterium]|nr:M20/M25/M40 family metallo-hydrolase [Trueperaceae bacterium]